jgi:hypothetical protein
MTEKAQRRDPVIEAVVADLRARSAVGLRKYGIGLDRTDLTLRDWLQHSYEECLDMANYLKRSIMELENGKDAEAAAAAHREGNPDTGDRPLPEVSQTG